MYRLSITEYMPKSQAYYNWQVLLFGPSSLIDMGYASTKRAAEKLGQDFIKDSGINSEEVEAY